MKTPATISRASALLAILAAGAMASVSASAATLSLPVSADTYIRSDQSNTNFSSQSELWVGQLNTPAGGNPGARFHSLLSFDLSAIPQNVVINSVSLTLYQTAEDNSSATTPITIDLHLVPSFVESSVTWNTVGAYDQTVLSEASVNLRSLQNLPTAITWNSTDAFVAAIQQIYNDGGSSVSFLLKHDNEADLRRQIAKFAAGGEFGATLNIDYAPIPESSTVALLFAAGAAGLIMLKRRSRG